VARLQEETTMRVCVTGATGLLGNNLVRMLLQGGHEVVAVVRSKEKAARLFDGLGLTFVEGDMKQVAGFAHALDGCELLFHTAAYFREYFQPGDHWAELKAINIDGTLELLAEAERRGVRRVIYTSSSGVIGMEPGQEWGDEASAPDALVMENLYFRSKLLAEQEIARFLAKSKLELVHILPGWMFGPGDAAPTSSGQIIISLIKNEQPGMIPGGGAPVDVRDVAQAMIAAADRGVSGERYIVGGDRFVSFRELADTFTAATGLPTPSLNIPAPLAYLIALASELSARLTGSPALITRSALRTLQERRTTRSAKAIRELGASFRPLSETLRDEVAWYRQHRPEWLSAPRAGRQAAQRS
jgi:dihydroflavonol-4-reductase